MGACGSVTVTSRPSPIEVCCDAKTLNPPFRPRHRRYPQLRTQRAGRTVDFRLSATRNVAAAKAFFRKAIKSQRRCPQTITLDGYAASHRAVRELKTDGLLPAETKLRSSKYLNNLIEQDHRGVKQRIAVMLGFKGFRNDDRRHRVAASHSEGTVPTGTSRRSRSSCTCSLERGPSGLNFAPRRNDCLLVLAICTRALDHGFSWQGTRYRSLSAIARTITGTAWSGPLFFGLKQIQGG